MKFFHLHLEILRVENADKQSKEGQDFTNQILQHIFSPFSSYYSSKLEEKSFREDSLVNKLSVLSLQQHKQQPAKKQKREHSDDSLIFVGATSDGILVESLDFLKSRSHSLENMKKKPLKSTNTTITNSKEEKTKQPTKGGKTGAFSDYRKGKINIEWIDSISPNSSSSSSVAISPIPNNSHIQTGASAASDYEDFNDLIPFMSGYTGISTGILRLYRDNHPHQQQSIDQLPLEGKVLCVLAVPSYMTPADFLHFMGPFKSEVSHYRILRDNQKNKFMVLLKFRSAQTTTDFMSEYNGKSFNSMQDESCHVVRIKSVQTSSPLPDYAFPTIDTTTISGNPGEGLIELPTCPVCLERMDSAASGLLTIICQHTFHCTCLSKWGDSTCPVCRCSQLGMGQDLSSDSHNQIEDFGNNSTVCEMCSSDQNLWICLICGHVGCGRYQQAHAYSHYLETTHLYALEIETQRVWDYAGDGYVHRLIQSKSDGKLVELPSDNQHYSTEKLDDLALEFTHLLTSSLEAQRTHFEGQLYTATQEIEFYHNEADRLDKKYKELAMNYNETESRNIALQERCSKQEEIINDLRSSLTSTDNLCRKTLKKLQETTKNLEEEQAFARQVSSNQPKYQEKIQSLEQRLQRKDEEVSELQEQVRDLMIFLEARDKIQHATNEEMIDGKILLSKQQGSGSKSNIKSKRR